MLEEAIRIAKGEDVEKIGMSVKMPVALKEKLVGLADRNDVSTNALICSILELTLKRGVEVGSIYGDSLSDELVRLEERRIEIMSYIDDNGGLDDSVPLEEAVHNELKTIENTIQTLKWVLV